MSADNKLRNKENANTYLKYWISMFHNNGLIKNYAMSKDDAYHLFQCLKRDKSEHFALVLATFNICKVVESTKSHQIVFRRKELDNILNDLQIPDQISRHTIHKPNGIVSQRVELPNKMSQRTIHKPNGIVSQKVELCPSKFPASIRELYLTKSKLIKTTSKNILIEIPGCIEDVLLLNTDKPLRTKFNITNVSNTTYSLYKMTEINTYIQNIPLIDRTLPLNLIPRNTISLDIHLHSSEPIVALFTTVFSFQSKNDGSVLHLSKTITIEVLSPNNLDLRGTSKYIKPVKKLNDIDLKDYVGLDTSQPITPHVVPLHSYSIPSVLQRLLLAKLKAFNNITVKENDYLKEIRKLVANENSGFYLTKTNYFELLNLLLHMEEYQLSVDIRNYDVVTRNLTRSKGYRNSYELPVPGLAERRPSLLHGDSVFLKGKNSATYQGVVRMVKEDSVILEVNRKFGDQVYTKGVDISVTYGYNRSIIRCEHRAIELLLLHRVNLPFFPTVINTSVDKSKWSDIKWFNMKIESNPQQQQAVQHILSKSSFPFPYLIFGPPGTGKTVTIVESIAQVWKRGGVNILVCAPSNSVANEITLRLTQYVPKSELFRYMSMSFDMYSIPDEVLPFTNYDCGSFYIPTVKEVCGYRIVISTLSNAPRLVSMGVPEKHFKYVFIDESGHATETETLLPIAGLLTGKLFPGILLGQIVLAGDPKQLGPIIHSSYARNYGFDKSMLERLMTTIQIYQKDPTGKYNPNSLTKLLHNYRSHPIILLLPNELFYDNELIPKAVELIDIALNWEKLPNPAVPIIFHSILGADQREANSPSYFNVQEVEIVMKYLSDLIDQRLKGRKILQKDIGVIAPYRKQVQKIRKACEKKNWNDLTIGSVEQFQGQERLIIVISTVRSQPNLLEFDNKFHLGFLNNPKRFNVALTRAKALVIVIGNPNLLQHEHYWREFIHFCKEKKCMTGAPFEFREDPNQLLALDMAKLRIDGETDDTADFSRGNI